MINDWKKALLPKTATLRECLETIDAAALNIALVVDEHNKLLGTVTDGDIRRGLIRRLTLNSMASECMFQQPTVGHQDDSNYQLINKIRKSCVRSIPIVSQEGVVIGLKSIEELTHTQSLDNPVLLMAGGKGTRLHPLTSDCPKPLLRVGSKPILETIIENFVEFGFWDFYISVHHMPEQIEDYFGNGDKWGISIRYLREEEPLGTAGALGLLPEDVSTLPMIIMNGDLLTKVNYKQLVQYHHDNAASATVCVKEYVHEIPYGVIQHEDGMVIAIEEKPIQQYFVNAGIYVLNYDVTKRIMGQYVDMPDIIESCIQQKDVRIFPIHEYWLDIGLKDDFKKAQSDFHQEFFKSS